MIPRIIFFAFALLAITAPCLLVAQDVREGDTDASDIALSFAVPESPAFTFLGITPSKVTRASNARDLGAALINSIDSTGRMLHGFALGATVWTLLPDVNVGLGSYQRDWKTYALANMHLSLGAARSSGDTADTDLALGLRTTLIDRSDPMQNEGFTKAVTSGLQACLDRVQQPNLPGPSAPADAPTPPDSEEDPALQCAEQVYPSLLPSWYQKNWNKPSLSWGIAMGWRVPRSELGAMDAIGVSTWFSGAYPFGRSGQLLGQLQFDHRTARGTLGATDVLTYGVRGARGTTRYNLFFEVLGTQRLKTAPTSSRSNVQWSGGIEFRAGQDYWLTTGFGERYAELGEPDQLVLIANLRMGITSKSRIGWPKP